jgi:hypothetical protein
MTASHPHPKSLSRRLLTRVGLAYVPEITQDTTGRTKVYVPGYTSKDLDEKTTTGVVSEDSAAPSSEQLDEVVANLAIKEKPSAERLVIASGEQERPAPTVVQQYGHPSLESDKTLQSRGPRSYSSDSSSTLNDSVKVAFGEYITSTCPHIAQPYFAKPLVLPGLSIEEIAGVTGWFTKHIKTELKWERYRPPILF